MSNEAVTMKEKEIDLIDLCVEILLRWRVIVVFMVIGAVLLGAFSFVQSNRSVATQRAELESAKAKLEQLLQEQEAAQKQAELELEQEMQNALLEGNEEEINLEKLNLKILEKQMTEQQLHNVDYALYYEQLYKDKLAYQENSVLMKMDPNAIKKGEITFHITSSDMIRTYNIQKAYEDLVNSGDLFDAVTEKTGMSSVELVEVICLERTSYSTIEGMDTLRLYVRHYDEQICAEIVQAIVDCVDKKSRELQETVGSHKITILDQSMTTVADTAIMNHQKTCYNDIISMRNTAINLKKAFSKLEWRYYDMKLNGVLTELSAQKVAEIEEAELEAAKAAAAANKTATTEPTADIESLEKIVAAGVTATAGISMKYVVLGMVLAAFVYVFVIFVMYILNNKIRATDNLMDLYGINQLGQVPDAKETKKLFGFVDRWILALRDRNKRKFTETEALALATVAVKMAVGKTTADTVYLIGCDLKERSLNVCEQIKEALQQDNIQVNILNNALYDAQAMGQLETAKCVVLVEKAGSTLYDEIVQELELLRRQDIKVLGGIVVE